MATITRANLRAQLRIQLEDTDTSSPKWDDDTLNQCLNWAITLHTTELPFAAYTSVSASGNEYELPALGVAIHLIRGLFGDSESTFIRAAERDDFVGVWTTGDEPKCFITDFPEEGSYYLPYAPTGDFTLYYGIRRAEMDDDEDTYDYGERAWTIPAICYLAGSHAFDPKSASRAGLEQWASKIDLNVDNPLDQESKRWYERYRTQMLTYAQPLSFLPT